MFVWKHNESGRLFRLLCERSIAMSVYGIQARQESSNLFQADTTRETERQESGRNTAPVSMTDYFFGLQEQFPGLAITIGTGQAESGLNNVSISPLMLEKMADDPDLSARYEARLSDLEQATAWLQKQYADDGMELTAHGTIIESSGDVSSWSKTALRPAPETPADSNIPISSGMSPDSETVETGRPVTEPTVQAEVPEVPVAPSVLLPEAMPAPSAASFKAPGSALYSRYLEHDGRYDNVPNKGSLLRMSG